MWRLKLIGGTLVVLIAWLGFTRFFGVEGCRECVGAKVQIDTFETALEQYKQEVGMFPTNEQGLAALRVNPGVQGWDGPYTAQPIPNDPWDGPYLYSNPGKHSAEPDIISLGADGAPGGTGRNRDIVSWKVN